MKPLHEKFRWHRPATLASTNIKRALEVISARGRWIKSAEAETSVGGITSAGHPAACRVCAWGALKFVSPSDHPLPGMYVSQAARDLFPGRADAMTSGGNVMTVNDHVDTERRDMLRIFRRGYQIARSAEAKIRRTKAKRLRVAA